MTSIAIIATTNKKFTIDLAKAELDSIQKQFLEELQTMLDKVRNNNNVIEYDVDNCPPNVT